MTDAPAISQAIPTRFGVARPEVVAETAIATIYKVYSAGGAPAALKLYRGADMGNEATGVAVMAAWQGQGVVRILGQAPGAVLMEWLEGPLLGDLSRGGQDAQAAATLLDVARSLPRVADVGPLRDLQSWFAALLRFTPGDAVASALRTDLQRARELALELLATSRDMQVLHGDLHFDNVRHGARGWVAFDAKGLWGERAYELANAFRHPADQPAVVRDPARIRALAAQWSAGLDVSPKRVLGWAAAKCALSILWRANWLVEDDPEADLLARLLEGEANTPG